MLKCENVCIWKSVKYSVRVEFEDSKKLLKIRGIIYHKWINIFATNILA